MLTIWWWVSASQRRGAVPEGVQERLASFALELHPEKTRLIEFGRFAQLNRQRRGEGKAETFTFLGFTHYWGSRRGQEKVPQ